MPKGNIRGIIVLVISVLVVFLSLLIPGLLLHLECAQTLGKAMQDDQLYYADNVSVGDGQNFDLKTRLMMKEGRWKTEKKQIQSWDIYDGDFILSKESMMNYALNLFEFLQSDLWLNDRVITDSILRSNRQVLTYIYYMTADDYAGNNLSFSERVQALAQENSKLTLYRYDDCVFNTYYFYVWEYSFKDDKIGMEVNMEVDAVTLELYSIRIHGDTFDQLPWESIMNFTIKNHYSEFQLYSNYMGDGLVSMPDSGEALILAYMSSYWMSLLYREPFFDTLPAIDLSAEKLETKENGYNFHKGNFIASQYCNFYTGDYPYWTRIENNGGNYVYCHISFDDGGMDWYMTAEQNDAT